MRSVRTWVRRHRPTLALLAAIAWILAIVMLILLDPAPGSGSPLH